ncbi:MAG: hypothetical protein H7X99_02015, partial [Saprospiraceae bacterium]|nr:hypothetical protein [Saprospiraceae bacterium]
NIIKNQKQIVENQVTLAVILKTQAKILFLLDKLAGDNSSESQINETIADSYKKIKDQFDKGTLKPYELNEK